MGKTYETLCDLIVNAPQTYTIPAGVYVANDLPSTSNLVSFEADGMSMSIMGISTTGTFPGTSEFFTSGSNTNYASIYFYLGNGASALQYLSADGTDDGTAATGTSDLSSFTWTSSRYKALVFDTDIELSDIYISEASLTVTAEAQYNWFMASFSKMQSGTVIPAGTYIASDAPSGLFVCSTTIDGESSSIMLVNSTGTAPGTSNFFHLSSNEAVSFANIAFSDGTAGVVTYMDATGSSGTLAAGPASSDINAAWTWTAGTTIIVIESDVQLLDIDMSTLGIDGTITAEQQYYWFMLSYAGNSSAGKPFESTEPVLGDFLTLHSDEGEFSFTTTTARASGTATLNFEYSTDATNWASFTVGYGVDATSLASSGGNLYLRGTGNTSLNDATNYSTYSSIFIPDGWSTGEMPAIYCYGYVETLLDHASVSSNTVINTTDYMFAKLFYNWVGLITAPEFKWTTDLAPYCYADMFYNCSALTTAPSLPATTLASHCYSSMFDRCISLTAAPALPATSLSEYCYTYMFNVCISLLSAPELPATTLADYCYSYMFSACWAITDMPALPATTLADYCYYNMFNNCTGLVTVSELPALTLVRGCYEEMFYGCTALQTVPSIKATSVENTSFGLSMAYMFRGCTALNTLPAIRLTAVSGQQGLLGMFYNCSNIKVSETQDDIYINEYRIPYGTGTVSAAANNLGSMFHGTGGSFTGTPAFNTTYYTSNAIVE